MTKPTSTKWQAVVRDYELDSQGIVNNATFLNYFEQARSETAKAIGLSLQDFQAQGYIFVVAGLEIRYYSPLVAHDVFTVSSALAGIEKKMLLFKQSLMNETHDRISAKATVRVACMSLESKKAAMPDTLVRLLETQGLSVD